MDGYRSLIQLRIPFSGLYGPFVTPPAVAPLSKSSSRGTVGGLEERHAELHAKYAHFPLK